MLFVLVEKRKDILIKTEKISFPDYPAVTVTIPAYNESKNVEKTVKSLLAMDYPKDKLFIVLVDDGSTDDTFEVIKQYENHPNIKIFTKENGGKYTANNLGLENSHTSFVGCLDADSEVDENALKRIMTYFDKPDVMAVTPTILVKNPKTIIQKAQSIEYEIYIYMKKALGIINAIHVTPGPFSIFRKEVFDKIGPYRHAHNTEDQEIALRMHSNHMKIEYAPDAFVYTIGPHKVKGLYKQRVRWVYGFIKNALDYKHMIFKAKYGNIGFITLPSAMLSVFLFLFLFVYFLFKIFHMFYQKYIEYQAVGFNLNIPSINFTKIDLFYAPSKTIFFITLFTYFFVITSLFIGQKVRYGKLKLDLWILYFIFLYAIIAPFWLLKSIYNAIRSYESSWTKERDIRGI